MAPGEYNGLGTKDWPGIGQKKLQIDQLRDVHQHPELIGENRQDPSAKLVTTSDDVGVFVTDHFA